MIEIGLAGCGHWGSNYLRIFGLSDEARIAAVCDQDAAVLERIRKQYRDIRTEREFEKLLPIKGLDAVVIATPAHTHHRYAKESLLAGKHVLVEKPLAVTLEECRELCDLARQSKRILMVGHTFLYNPGIRKMKECIQRGLAGEIYYLTSVRTHLGRIRNDVNTVWDLAPHDISILSYLLGKEPLKVSAVGISPLKQSLEDVAFMNLFYEGNVVGHVHISWIDANKSRQVAVIGSRARILFDDLNPLERIRIYEKGVSIDRSYKTFGEFQLLLRDGDIISPRVEPEEPLQNLCMEFIHSIQSGTPPLTDGVNGLNVVKTMWAIQKSIEFSGRPVEVDGERL